MTKCKVTNTIKGTFTVAYSTTPVDIEVYIDDGKCVIQENNRCWKFDSGEDDWVMIDVL